MANLDLVNSLVHQPVSVEQIPRSLIYLGPLAPVRRSDATRFAKIMAGIAGRPPPVVVVNSSSKLSQVDPADSPLSSLSLADALHKAGNSCVVICDPDFEFSENRVCWPPPNNDRPLLIVDRLPKGTSWCQDMLLQVHDGLSRCFLKTQTNRFRPAMAIGTADQFADFIPNDAPPERLFQIVSRMRYANVPIEELSWHSANANRETRYSLRDFSRAMLESSRLWWNHLKFPTLKRPTAVASVPRSRSILAWTILLLATVFTLSLNLNS